MTKSTAVEKSLTGYLAPLFVMKVAEGLYRARVFLSTVMRAENPAKEAHKAFTRIVHPLPVRDAEANDHWL